MHITLALLYPPFSHALLSSVYPAWQVLVHQLDINLHAHVSLHEID